MAKREKTDFIEHYKLVAHRGLHDIAKGVPENSMTAFQLAIDRGHAIELDLRITADRQVVVFHDGTLDRMTGVPGQVDRWTLADLKKLRLQGTEECIPTLEEMLALVNGQVPLLIEIKRDPHQEIGRLESILVKRLADYSGMVILESFDPEVLVWLRRNAPQYIRGQLGSISKSEPKLSRYSKYLLFNPMVQPDFIAFNIRSIDYKLRMNCKKHNVPLVGWTIRTQEDLKRARQLCDGIIYEKVEV
ncbi:MAG: glycerophosphodiester phosphodiesterase [Clostridia bacterium]|nr:glycerophosphodiester phosphodiesterase [Clostridia bacterium]